MALVIDSQPVPLKSDTHGIVRVGRTRVTLDTIVYAFRDGATPEEIVVRFPSLDLGDVYAVIAYYLRHRDSVDRYVRANETASSRLRHKVEHELPTSEIRSRLLARRRTRSAST